jgi:hypothetical protein
MFSNIPRPKHKLKLRCAMQVLCRLSTILLLLQPACRAPTTPPYALSAPTIFSQYFQARRLDIQLAEAV